jgi:DNA modification methylase/DNA-directed RNA polymerase subunit RPC12/RpoP
MDHSKWNKPSVSDTAQTVMFEGDQEKEAEKRRNQPVECLGMTFLNDEERRNYFLEKLREKLQDPEFRKIEGFPIGEDEDILAISDPPYYTACPNPFIADFLKFYKKAYDLENDDYKREPFAADVSEGKNNPIYTAHSYHTKVPHKAIMRYLLHYTEPGDVVFDGFCGTGMTGIAASYCDDRKTIESLGFKVNGKGHIKDQNGKHCSNIGKRVAILGDLSPIGTFISYNLNFPTTRSQFSKAFSNLLDHLSDIQEQLYSSFDEDGTKSGMINYVIWSDVYVCSHCSNEYVYWHTAVDLENGIAHKKFSCPYCGANQSTRNLDRAYTTGIDPFLGTPIRLFKQVPVRVSFISFDGKKRQRPWNSFDDKFVEGIECTSITQDSFPIVQIPRGDRWKRDAFDDKGVTHLHHFYTIRTIEALSRIWQKIKEEPFDYRSRMALIFLFTSFADRNATKRNRFVFNKHNPRGRVNGPMANSLYLPNLFCEMNIIRLMSDKYRDITRAFPYEQSIQDRTLISTGSSSYLRYIPSNSIDYIFTDPPFGHNIQYSELNLVLESFLEVKTESGMDTVVNEVAGKSLQKYLDMMLTIFTEYYRILKPGRWLTIEFHNSKSAVWNAIQEALGGAGFVIAHVATLDKKQRTVHQDTNISGTVNQDLAISAYKPNEGIENRFKIYSDTESVVWDFVREHLNKLPVFLNNQGLAAIIPERQSYLLFDRMVAFHVQRGATVPMSASEFYSGLKQIFSERDSMFFLPEQVAEYDKMRMTVREIMQLELFVTDENSAIQWLKQQLTKKPQTFQELHPQFLKEIGGWQKHEKPLELSELLEHNFLRYDGKGPIPAQIVSWMRRSSDLRSTILKELDAGRAQEDNGQLITDASSLINRAKDRWYLPDPNKAADLEKLRERSLLREFQTYTQRTKKFKRNEKFRMEAVRAGFKKAWQERDYATIIDVAGKIPENILQEDPKLLMWYDQAVTRTGGE